MKNLTLDATRYQKVRDGHSVKLGRLIPGLGTDSIEWSPVEVQPDCVICEGRYAGAVVVKVRMRGEPK